MRIGLKNQSGSLFLMITAQPAPESGNCCFLPIPSLPASATTPPLFCRAPLSLRLFRVHPSLPLSLSTVSLFPFPRAAHHRVPTFLSQSVSPAIQPHRRRAGARGHTDLNTADVYKRQTVPGRR